MGHSLEPPAAPRAAVPPTRPRYGRLTAACSALLVTLVAVLGGVGILPTGSSDPRPTAAAPAPSNWSKAPAESSDDPSAEGVERAGASPGLPSAKSPEDTVADPRVTTPAPDGSGTGRRIVFDMAAQRVWLVDRAAGRDVVRRSYLVSGSVTDNLKTGTYAVYSRSLHAVGVDDSGTMRYMVRFTRGDNAAIGFHDIPVDQGKLVQSRDELGSAQSHGCIRQWRPDAQALWRFAPTGTKVVVV